MKNYVPLIFRLEILKVYNVGKDTSSLVECLDKMNSNFLIELNRLDYYIETGIHDFLRLFFINQKFTEHLSLISSIIDSKRKKDFYCDLQDFVQMK